MNVLQVQKARENREDLEEKFGKFPMPQHGNVRHRDETHSVVSDAWSTDVVASDNEGAGADTNVCIAPLRSMFL